MRRPALGVFVLAVLLIAAPVLVGVSTASPRARQASGSPLTIASPNGALTVTVSTEGQLTWSVSVDGRPILLPSRIALALADRTLGDRPVVSGTTTRASDQVLRPAVPIKRGAIRDAFKERRIDFGNYSLLVRAYDDGVAYRWVTRLPGEIEVRAEDATFVFADDHAMYFPEETSLLSHQERLYKQLKISEIGTRFSSLPAMVAVTGAKVVITEADLLDYPGMDLTAGTEPHSLKGLFPAYPTKVTLVRDRNERVDERAPYLARTRGTREFPWRVMVVAERDADLLETDIVYRLASETAIGDTSWIKPGKVAWDWWNANNVFGVPFRAGVNTDTYKHYIDFAAENGIQYVILDEGWYRLGDLLSIVPEMDMEAIAAHARQKNIGLIMWVVWKTLDRQMQAALDQFERWGVKGIKVDFMQREDQWMVNFYERTAREAAKRHMLVDFHGAYKPTGLYRTYPNVITSEGVVGMEHSKWSKDAGPENAVTFPFLRMLAGPVDYTPGAMLNATKQAFQPIYNRPMSQGTRCQQLAMYVVFESPLQMLADSPAAYRGEQGAEFLKAVPASWDETRVLDGKIGEYVVIARRRGADWFVGAITDAPRRLTIPLAFAGPGTLEGTVFADVPETAQAPTRVGITPLKLTSTSRAPGQLTLDLVQGGGAAVQLHNVQATTRR